MDLAAFERLLAAPGQRALAAATDLQPTELTFLSALQRLQKQFDAELAKAALETVILRAKARGKFSRADQMYFTREALEQASGELIAAYRAARYAGRGQVADLGCGIGGDAIALSARAALTIVDVDALRLRLARANLAAYGRTATALQADVTAAALPEADGLWFDPARRVGGRRKFSVRDYHPSLAIVRHWLARTPTLGVKISPGVDLDELAEVLGEDGPRAEVEFISVDRELKECALWFGPLKTAARRATLLPGPHTLTADPRAASVVGAPGRYLFEPDPAVLRAGLVTTLAVQLGARQLDPEIAYLAADAPSPTPFARTYSVEDAFPFQLKRLREYLRARGVGQVTVKKRGSPLEPEALIRSLRLAGDESRIVFLTQVAGKPHVLIGQAV